MGNLQDKQHTHYRNPIWIREKIIALLKKKKKSENFPNVGRKMNIQIHETPKFSRVEPEMGYTKTHFN